jgi:glutamate synthase (NADPH/NADH) large chain
MMRKCHLNTCPVGIATQNPVLRKRFGGTPEHVINYFFFVAEELREIMASLGFRSVREMIGRADRLDMTDAVRHWKTQGIDLSRVLYQQKPKPGVAIYNCEKQAHDFSKALDLDLIEQSKQAIESKKPVRIERAIRNVDRTVGAMLSGEIARVHGHAGLPEDTIAVRFTGNAGQSFGAFLSRGVSLELTGDANDYLGKGLSGGRIVVRQPKSASREPTENIIVGNTVLYGAIAGEAYIEGVAGERFAVRNSGAVAVVEGTGDHGCEYMTGGVVAVLGTTGRNFAAGMSGGIAYVYDPDGEFEQLANKDMIDIERIGPVSEGSDEAMPRQKSVSVSDSGMGDPLRFDAERLRILVQRHLLHTKSARAQWLLDHWEDSLRKFVKIMPKEYRRALMELQAETREAAE